MNNTTTKIFPSKISDKGNKVKYILLPFSFLIMALLLVACNAEDNRNTKNFDQHEINFQQIKENLELDQKILREDPFVIREFDPHLKGKWIGNAISYGCYRKGQAPGDKGPSKEEIFEDLTIITQHWNLIRIYNADDDTERIFEVIREHSFPVKVMLGVWLENETNNKEKKHANITNILRCIKLANKYEDLISAVNVGNETQVFWSWHKMDNNDLIRYIRMIRNYTSIPITSADDYNFWNKPESKKVADEIDFIVTHIYPLWNGKNLGNAIKWLDETFQEVKKVHSEKQLVLGEVGWATKYNADKKGDGEQGTLVKGEVSINAQGEFLVELEKWYQKNKITPFQSKHQRHVS